MSGDVCAAPFQTHSTVSVSSCCLQVRGCFQHPPAPFQCSCPAVR
ncbi:MAG: small cysteine-rich outer membrane protein [Bacteroidaceae bacterium]|nr:small cysteine-rich outer membrane protein [Bacteroidaceae bacterium]